MDKKKRSLKIFYFGIISQVATLLLGIIIPRLLLVNYGSEINGLLSSIKQVFVYVSLLEAGVGTASLQALYAPIALDDKQKVSEIMAATDRYYKKTGIFYAISVILLSIIYPLTVKTDLKKNVIIAIIVLQGMSGVIKYFFQGKYTVLLRVDGRSYITTNTTTIVNIASHFAQIILILLGFNIVMVQFAYFVINTLQMIYITYYIKKYYSWLNLKVSPNYNSLKQSRNVIIHQISSLIFNNTDSLLLTFFCGLKTVSIYSLYSLIVNCASNIIDTICSSVEFILGQAFSSDKKYFLKLQDIYETYYLAVSFAFFNITFVMLPSFIKIYSAGISDVNYIDKYLPYLFIFLNTLVYARRTSSQIINFAGHFKQTQLRSIIESSLNLIVSFALVRNMGIYGVLIGSIVASLYRTIDIIIYANKSILGVSPIKVFRRWVQNLLVMICITMIINSIIPSIDNYVSWFLCALCVAPSIFVVYFIIDSFFDRKSFFALCSLLKTSFDKKVKS